MRDGETMHMRIPLAVVAILLAAGAAFAQSQAWSAGWVSIAFLALITSYFLIGIAFMYAVGFQDARMEAWCKHEFYQNSATAVLLGALLGVSALMDNVVYPAFWSQSIINPDAPRGSATGLCTGTFSLRQLAISMSLNSLKYYSPPSGSGFKNIQNHAVGYVSCLRSKVTGYILTLSIGGMYFGFLSSLMLDINFLEMQFGMSAISPGALVRPLSDFMGYANTLVTLLFLQLKVQEMALAFARDYAFTFLLPVGVALRAFALTRRAGGALISIAVGFYIVLPVTYLFQEEITASYCASHNCRASLLDNFGGSGNISDVLTALLADAQRGGALGKGITFAGSPRGGLTLADIMSVNGPLGPIFFIAGISGAVLPAIGLITTFMFMKSFGSVLGSDVDFSSLMKII